ncbi:MAG: hypothetical protein IPI79_10780 [Moraxellaceae bacterium]|nr:hypothetical protein [Moraxellaceae bacterium]
MGKVNFQIPKDIKDVLIEVSGGGVAKYFDEAKGEQDLPSGVTLRAAASAITDNSNVGVSVFTEAAVQHAEKLTDGLKKSTNIIDANKKIGDAVGISNITQAPALIGQNSDYQQLADDAASAYALQLAALVKAASASIAGNTPALDLLEKLAADLSDGLIDGKNDTTTLTSVPYATLASVFAASWQLAMHEVINTLTNTELQAKFVSNVVNKVDIKEVNIGTIVTDDTDFGGASKAAWKGEIYLLATGTSKLPDFNTLEPPIGTLFTSAIDIDARPFTEPFPGVPSDRFEDFGVRYQGPLTISEAGDYNFRIISDDGSKLFIDDVLVINHDGLHGPSSSARATVNLNKGVHTLRVEYFQGPRTYIALQVFGNKVGLTEKILTPVVPTSNVVEAAVANAQ